MKIVSRPTVTNATATIDDVVDLMCQVFALNPARQTSDDYWQIANGCLFTLVVQNVIENFAIMPVRANGPGHGFVFSIKLTNDPLIYDISLVI
jgi:hypothetical protein